MLHAGQARGGGSNTIVLDAQASAADGAYVGLPIRLVAGAGASGGGVDPIGKPAIGRIVAYNGSSRTATVDRPWPAGARIATAFEASHVIGSKFKVPQSHDDCTHYVLGGSSSFAARRRSSSPACPERSTSATPMWPARPDWAPTAAPC